MGSTPVRGRGGERRALRCGEWGVAVCRRLSLCVGASVHTFATFPRPRSSNWTCGYPASSFPTKSCPRPRKALGLRRKVDQAVERPQPMVREAHVLPFPDLVLPTEPLSQPFRRVRIECRVGGADLSEVIVVRPAGQHPVQALHLLSRQHQPVLRSRPRPACARNSCLILFLTGEGRRYLKNPAWGRILVSDCPWFTEKNAGRERGTNPPSQARTFRDPTVPTPRRALPRADSRITYRLRWNSSRFRHETSGARSQQFPTPSKFLHTGATLGSELDGVEPRAGTGMALTLEILNERLVVLDRRNWP